MNSSNKSDATASEEVEQIQSQITSRIQSITTFHIIGFIFGTGTAIPPVTTSIGASLWYLLFVMVLLYLAASGSRFEKRSLIFEFALGMWGSLGTVYIIAIWYYFSQQISLFPLV